MPELTAEAIKLIQETATKAADAKIVRFPGDDAQAFFVVNGHAEPLTVPPPPRCHEVGELSELCRYLNELSRRVDERVVVWHNAAEVVAVLDDDDRRDHVTLALYQSTAWQWIEQAAERPSRVDVRKFLSLLRTTLADNIADDERLNFETALRNVRFTRKDESTSQNERGLEALGKSIAQSVAGAADIPETLTIRTAVYRNAFVGEIVQVAFDVSIDFDKSEFVLTPIGDHVAAAVDAVQLQIGAFIRSQTKRDAVFYGRP